MRARTHRGSGPGGGGPPTGRPTFRSRMRFDGYLRSHCGATRNGPRLLSRTRPPVYMRSAVRAAASAIKDRLEVAVKFDLFDNAGEGVNSTGFYTNGAAPTVPAWIWQGPA